MSEEKTDAAPPASPNALIGIPGLDDILNGGLPRRRLYLVRGKPGTGKTTLAMEFLLTGVRAGERCLYITLSETKEELEAVAQSHGWSLDGIRLIELSSIEHRLKPAAQTTLLHPAEVELTSTMQILERELDTTRPHRVVLDSLAELRLMAQNPLRYRRQILSLKTFLATQDSTVVLLDDGSAESSDQQVESISHGVVELEHLRPEYGSERRRLSVLKLRGVKFRGGYHDYVIATGGLKVFPRLVAAEHEAAFLRGRAKSGIKGLDELLDGGLDWGTSSLFIGPAGAGKSTLAVQYAAAAALRGEACGYFAFDESLETVRARTAGLGTDLDPLIASGQFDFKQVDPGELAPGEFASLVRQKVDSGAKVIVIDSLNGYMNAMPDERFLLIQLHELQTYLAHRGVMTILVVAQHGLLGEAMKSPVDLTYVADTVVLFRYFEFEGEIRNAISVVKKRSGAHERTIRELRFVSGAGVEVGAALRNLRGVLTGTPAVSHGAEEFALRKEDDGKARA
jgi:circadian clock protein KaiC